MSKLKYTKNFSLAELLIVISIFFVLFSLLLPSIRNVQQINRLSVCSNHQHQIYTVSILYSDDYSGYLPNNGRLGIKHYEYWPRDFYEGGYLEGSYTSDEPTGILECPSSRHHPNGKAYFEHVVTQHGDLATALGTSKKGSDYGFNLFIIGGANFPYRPFIHNADLSTTYLLAETNDQANIIYPRSVGRGIGVYHGKDVPGGFWEFAPGNKCNMLYCDGHVKSLAIDYENPFPSWNSFPFFKPVESIPNSYGLK